MNEDFFFNLAEAVLSFGGGFYCFCLGFIAGAFFVGLVARLSDARCRNPVPEMAGDDRK